MRNLTGRFVALAIASALIAGCSTQQASMPQAPAASVVDPGAPIEFQVVRDERNSTGCTRFNFGLARPITFRETGNTASFTIAGITSNMTQTSPGVYTADYYSFGSNRVGVVVNVASSPKSLTFTVDKSLGCRWSAVAP